MIAILADTYKKFTEVSLGLYYDGIITRIPVYEDDDRYGGLILGSPPFNVFALLMIPFYLCIKDEDRLRRFNNFVTKMLFTPIAIVTTVFFMFFTSIMLPFAYFAAIFKKIKLMRRKRSTLFNEDESDFHTPTIWEVLLFILFGLPMLILAWLKDIYFFLKSTYREDVREFGFGDVST